MKLSNDVENYEIEVTKMGQNQVRSFIHACVHGVYQSSKFVSLVDPHEHKITTANPDTVHQRHAFDSSP